MAKTSSRITRLITGKKDLDPELLEELEETLLTSDIGVETSLELIQNLKERVEKNPPDSPDQLKNVLKEELKSILKETGEGLPSENMFENPTDKPHVTLFVGVNGVGKTTTIAKMSHYFKRRDQKVMLVAADTFRHAAIEQLQIWGDRTGAEVITQKRGADPAAVVYDALSAARARNTDRVLIDTAGRLHTKSNLMEELSKLRKVAGRQVPGSPHRITLVLDATTGQNAIIQAREFSQFLGITDIVLTKLDGTAKGGIVVAVARKLQIPISFLSIGEGLNDLQEFNTGEFVDALFA